MQAGAFSVTVDSSGRVSPTRVIPRAQQVDRVVPNAMARAIVNGLGTSRST